MAFATLELVDGSVPLTIFPEPYRSCAVALRHTGPVIVRGRVDDSDKGRVVLAEEVKPLEEAMGTRPAGNGRQRHRQRSGQRQRAGSEHGASAHACRIRVSAAAGSLPELLAAVRRPARSTRAARRCSSTCCCPSRKSWCGPRSSRWMPAPRPGGESGRPARAGQYTRRVCRTSLSSRSRSSSSRTASRSCAPPRTPREARATRSRKLEERLAPPAAARLRRPDRLAARAARPPPEAPAHARLRQACSSTTSSSCTATASSATTRRSWAASPASRASRWW